MNVAICDDNIQDIAQIRTLLGEHFHINGYDAAIHTYTSGESLLAAFTAQTFDAVFLDIYMNGMSGIKTAEKLREKNPDFALVFITVSRDHALESYSCRACAYVLKPISYSEINNAFLQCRHIFIKNGRFIEIISDRRKVRVPLAKIVFIEVYGKQILIHTTDRIIKTTTPLDHLEQLLNSTFLRCHRSYIVNLNHTEAILTNDFRMNNGRLVPMRQRGRSELRDTYAQFLSNRLFEVST